MTGVKHEPNMTMRRMVAIDLFSGCGGLTCGLRRAGFHVATAVEIDPHAAKTYRHNNRKTKLLQADIRKVEAHELLAGVPSGEVDLLVGCAPCQGFSSLTRKYRRDDPRNGLLSEMARIIEEVRPSAVMMENVSGLAEARGKVIFKGFVDRLENEGYHLNWRVVQMADYGIPQSRRRLVLIGGRGFEISFPDPTHARTPKPGSDLKPWVPLRSALAGLGAPVTLTEALRKQGPQQYNWHVARDLLARTKAKLKAAMPGKAWLDLPENLRPKCHQGDYRGFPNVYGRMSWDNVAVTMTRGCTTPSMGRFGHPDRRRYAISAREAARIQTFPDAYKFITDHMETVCDMLGNAVPPAFAYVIGRRIKETLEVIDGAVARTG